MRWLPESMAPTLGRLFRSLGLAITVLALTALSLVYGQSTGVNGGGPNGGGSGGTGTVTNVATGTGLTGGPITTTGAVALVTPVAIVNGGTGSTTATGTGSVVLATSPTLVTPNLGTPSALVLTNATGLTTPALPAFSGDCTTPGASGVLTCTKTNGVAFGPAATVATTTGSGSVVLGTSPTITTPNLTTPTAINLANATNLPISALPSLAAYSSYVNATNASAVPTSTSLMAAGNIINVGITVDLASGLNVTTSGVQTVDGVTVTNGMVVLLYNQSGGSPSGVNSGFYTVNTAGAWSRWSQLPTGFVINTGCLFSAKVLFGTVHAGETRWLNTTSTVTIGTSAQNWQAVNENASSTVAGKVLTPANNNNVPSVNITGMQAFDCISALDNVGTLADTGNALNSQQGGCATESLTTGQLFLDGQPPTASVGTVDPNSVYQRFRITGLTAAASVAVTFTNGGFPYVPVCFGSNSAGTLVTYTPNTTTPPVTSATFTMVALTGTLYGVCF